MDNKQYIAAILWDMLDDGSKTDDLYVICQEMATILNTADDPKEVLDKMSWEKETD